MTTQTKLVTADELLAMPDDGYRYELIRGVLIRKIPHGDTVTRTASLIVAYAENNDYGAVRAESRVTDWNPARTPFARPTWRGLRRRAQGNRFQDTERALPIWQLR